MIDKELIDSAGIYIENRLNQTKRKFELIYATSRDLIKKQEMRTTINKVEKDIKKLKAGFFESSDLAKYKIEEDDLLNNMDHAEKKEIELYKILRNIRIEPLNKLCANKEVNSIWSYLHFFEKEYLGLLSEQNLKLDYALSFQRDNFFNKFNEVIRFMERYGELLEQVDQAIDHGNKEYRERMIGLQSKHYRDIILKVGKFIREIESFVEEIKEAKEKGVDVILEPYRIIEITGSDSSINGITAKEALDDLYLYTIEFIDFLKIPEINKIEDNE